MRGALLIGRVGLSGVLAVLSLACGPAGSPLPGDEATPRIVVMAPAAGEMLETLDLLDRVVAIGAFGPWPAALEDLPEAGGYNDPNVERVLALKADWLVTTASESAVPAHRNLEQLGVRVLALDTSTYDGVFESLAQVGQSFGREQRAGQVAGEMRARLARIEERARGLAPRKVLFVVGRDPLFVAGPGSHIDQLIRLVGGDNVTGDVSAPYQRMSVETVLERLPEVIVDTSDNRPGAPRGRRPASWARWPFLPAVQQDRVYWVEPAKLVIPGLRLPEMAELLGQLIHPEVFGFPGAEILGEAGESEPS